MDSTQDTQTDAPGRAGELRQQVERIVAGLAASGYNFMKPEAVPRDVQQGYVNSIVRIITSATRTAVTEERERILAGLPEKIVKCSADCHYGENCKQVITHNSVVETVRAVIAAGGKQS